MRRLLVTAVIAGGLLPCVVSAQRGGGGAPGVGGGARGGGAMHPGGGHVGNGQGGNWHGGNWQGGNSRGWNGRQGFNRSGYGGNFGYGYGGFGYGGFGYPYAPDYGWGESSQASPLLVLMPVPPPPEPEPPAPPPPPAQPVMHEYSWPGVASNPAARFSIVSRNGQVREAVAVWTQDREVRYLADGGRTGSLAASAIDCGASGRMNAKNNLTLSLPGCAVAK